MEFLDTIEKHQGWSHEETKGDIFQEVAMARTKNNLKDSKQDGAHYQDQKERDDAHIFLLGLEDIGWRVLGDINVHVFLKAESPG